MGKHFDWSLFSIWSELLSAMTDINSIWTSGWEWEEGEKNTPVTKEEAHSRNVMSNCSQPLCTPSPPHFWPLCTSTPKSILQRHGAVLPQVILRVSLWNYWVMWKMLLANTRESKNHTTSRASAVSFNLVVSLGFGPWQKGWTHLCEFQTAVQLCLGWGNTCHWI